MDVVHHRLPQACSGLWCVFPQGEDTSYSVVSGRAKMGICEGPVMAGCVQDDQLAYMLGNPQVMGFVHPIIGA